MTVDTPAAGGTFRTLRLYGLIAFTVVVWGVNWPVMKLALAEIPPVWFSAWRVAIATVFFFALFAVRRKLPRLDRRDLPVLASLAILQLCGTMGLVHIAMTWVEPGRSAIISHTHPLWAAPLALIFLKEQLSWVRLAGIGLGLTGVVVIFNPLSLDWSQQGALLGHLLLLWSAFNLAAGMVHMRGHRWAGSPLDVMPWANLAATIILTGLAFAFRGESGACLDAAPGRYPGLQRRFCRGVGFPCL